METPKKSYNNLFEQMKSLVKATIQQEFQKLQQLESAQTDILCSEEACKFLKVSKVTLHKWINDGRIKCYHLSSKMYFKKSELEQAILRNNS